MKKLFFTVSMLCISTCLLAQLVSGPYAGNCELRNATIWAEVKKGVNTVAIELFAKNAPAKKTTVAAQGPFNNCLLYTSPSPRD